MNNIIKENRNIVGDNNNSGDTIINSQVSNSKVLNEALLRYGVEQDDINELLTILKMKKPDENARQPGDYAQTWINKVIKKAKQGIGNISLDITATILAQCIMKYYEIVQ